jgi:hypothetical protein
MAKNSKGGADAKAAGNPSTPGEQNLNQNPDGNTGTGSVNQPAPGAGVATGAAITGTATNQNAGNGTTEPNKEDAARLAEEQRAQEAARQAELQAQQDALAAKKAESQNKVPALFIKTKSGSFRRAGFRFTEEPYGIALECLTDGQIQALKSEPSLIVEEGDFLLDSLDVTEVS